MKLEINTTDKTITILDDIPVLELITFLKEKELDSYSIKSVTKIGQDKLVEKHIEYVPIHPITPWIPNQPIWVYDPNSSPTYTTLNTQ